MHTPQSKTLFPRTWQPTINVIAAFDEALACGNESVSLLRLTGQDLARILYGLFVIVFDYDGPKLNGQRSQFPLKPQPDGVRRNSGKVGLQNLKLIMEQ